MTAPLLVVRGHGLVTPIGSSSAQTVAAWIANHNRFRRQPLGNPRGPRSDDGATVTVAEHPALATLKGKDRWRAALLSSIAEAAAGTAADDLPAGTSNAVIIVALSDRCSDDDARALQREAAEAAIAAQPGWRNLAIKTLGAQFGAAGGLLALKAAYDHIRQDPAVGLVVIAGVDSLCEPGARAAAIDGGLAHCTGNTEGAILAEAAATVVLTRLAERRQAQPGALILHEGVFGRNPQPYWPSDTEADGRAFAQVIAGALRAAGLGQEHISHEVNDVDGSAWRARLLHSASVHLDDKGGLMEALEPAIRLGQVGAAWAPLEWALVAALIHHRADRIHSALCWVLDPGGAVGAAVIERMPVSS